MFRLIAILLLVATPIFAQTGQRMLDRSVLNSPPPPVQIYIYTNGQQVGPLDAAGFQAALGSPEAAASTMVWMPGMAGWELASTVPQLQGIIAAIGLSSDQTGEFRVADIQSYMLGAWITEKFDWTINDKTYNSIIQIKVLADGRFEGATLFWDKEDSGFMRVDHEKGTWSIAQKEDGSFEFARNISASVVVDAEIVNSGQFTDTLNFRVQGPNAFVTAENITAVRVPEAN